MFRNFINISVRSFLRQKFYSVINIAGLTSGLLCVFFIYLWVSDELSMNRIHNEGEKIYRVISNLNLNEGEIVTWTVTPGPLGEDIEENDPDAELATRVSGTEQMLVDFEGQKGMERGYYADASFFKMFTFPIIAGKAPSDPKDVSSVTISQRLAEKLFGTPERALGKTLRINSTTDVAVTGVFLHPGTKTTMNFDFVLPYEIYKKNRGQGFNWGNYDHALFVKTDPANVTTLIDRINTRAQKRSEDGKSRVQFYLQPYYDTYLYSRYENGQPVGGRISYVRIFSLVGLFMLIIACINFTNMATARAAFRAKEVGIRKVVGAYRRSLIWQFILESVFTCLIAMVLAVMIAFTLLPAFNTLVDKKVILDFSEPNLLISIAVIVLVTGFAAGSYPALYLSSYQPATVLKGTQGSSFRGASLRKLLVVFQFTLTVILIASSIVVYSQIDFIRNKNLGYDRESIISVRLTRDMQSKYEAFSHEMNNVPGIISFGRSNESLVEVNNQNGSVNWPGKDETASVFFRTIVADYGFMETMGVKLKEGRLFSREHNDTITFVLTEKAVQTMGLTDPIGTVIEQWGMSGPVIGVVEDLHVRSMHEAIDPLVFLCNPDWTWKVFVRLNATQAKDAIAGIEDVYKKFNTEFPFEYTFLDEDFERLYKTEQITGVIALVFTIMAIIISGLGLLALAAYTAERKRKEISIRKTLGASVSGIVMMISSEFVKLSIIAALIGSPLAYFAMSEFLSGYAFHMELDWSVFVLTAAVITVICILTVIFQVIKAAIANPVDALRNE